MLGYIACLLALISQSNDPKSIQDPKEIAGSLIERASSQPNFDDAGAILCALLNHESTMRAALEMPLIKDKRILYMLYENKWGRKASVTKKMRSDYDAILVKAVSLKPDLIKNVLYGERCEGYIRKHSRYKGFVVMQPLKCFEDGDDVDDVIEYLIEMLRRDMSRPVQPLVNPRNNDVFMSIEEVKQDQLLKWQLVCGICNRIDLIDRISADSWRTKFSEVEEWFHKNRPFLYWSNEQSCALVDDEAKKYGRPITRKRRSIPEFKPDWMTDEILGFDSPKRN